MTVASWRVCGVVLILVVLNIASQTTAWSNGGYSSNPSNPNYGTHDWIAQHALDFLPLRKTVYIRDNMAAYLYGTELPDNDQAADGIGDRHLHHVYFHSDHSLQDNAAAVRAQEEFDTAVTYLEASNYYMAAKTAGIMAGYLTDLSVFGHVMGSGTDWGPETHHSDYEDYVKDRTMSYTSSMFDSYLSFDDTLEYINAYDATLSVAYDTTFGKGEIKDCVWMDDNYDWSDPLFKNSAGASLNRAVNALADVLHTLAVDADYPGPDTVPPSVTITSPTASPTYATANHSVTLSGTANDDWEVSSVKWQNAATNLSGDATGTTSWTATINLLAGYNLIMITAYDIAGNEGTDTINVTYDSTRPSITITSPEDGETLTSRTVIVTGTASDNFQVQKVQISIDETNWIDCTGTTSWLGTLTLPSGSSRIYAKVTDAAGNWKVENVRVNIDVPIDEAPSFNWLPIAIIIGIVGSLVFYLWLRRRKKRK